MGNKKSIEKKPVLLSTSPMQIKLVKGDIYQYFQQYMDHFQQTDFQKQSDLVNKGEITLVNQLFPEQLCRQLIQCCENIGFDENTMGIGTMNYGIRDSVYVILEDIDAAKFLTKILQPCVSLCYEGAIYLGLDEKFKIFKFTQHQQSQFSCDQRINKSDQTVSLSTVQFNLNNVDYGGQNAFLYYNSYCDKQYQQIKIQNKEGQALIYRQDDWLHEGQMVQIGIKYTIKGNLLYQWQDNQDVNQYVGKQCGICQKKVQILELASCNHKFLYCGCHPYNRQVLFPRLPICGICKNLITVTEDNKQIYEELFGMTFIKTGFNNTIPLQQQSQQQQSQTQDK